MAAHAPFNKTNTTIGHKILQNCYWMEYSNCVPEFLFFFPIIKLCRYPASDSPCDDEATLNRLSVLLQMLDSATRGRQGDWRSGEGRRALLILSASSPSEYLPSNASHQHQHVTAVCCFY